MAYKNQTRTLTAETGQVAINENGQKTYKKFYYFRLDDNLTLDEIKLTDRLTAQNPSGTATFDLGLVKSWASGGSVVEGLDSDNPQAPRRAASLDEIDPEMVVGKILVLTPTTESSTQARGTLTYTYDVHFNSPDATDDESPFTINWTADPKVITSVFDIDVNPATAESVIYYNLAGQSSDIPFEGVNIVVTRYDNGNSTTAKVVK